MCMYVYVCMWVFFYSVQQKYSYNLIRHFVVQVKLDKCPLHFLFTKCFFLLWIKPGYTIYIYIEREKERERERDR